MKVIYLSTMVPNDWVKEASTSRIVENNMASGIGEMLYAIYGNDMQCVTIQPRLKEENYEHNSTPGCYQISGKLKTRVVKSKTTPYQLVITGLRAAVKEINNMIEEWLEAGEEKILLITYNAIPPMCLVPRFLKRKKIIKTACVLLDSPVFPEISTKVKTMVVKVWNLFAVRIFEKYDAGMAVAARCVTDFDKKKKFLQLLPGVTQHTLEEIPFHKPVYQEEIILTYAGNVSHFNGVDNLIKMMKYLPEHYKLHILGSGELEGYVRESQKVCPQICFHGLCSHEEVLEQYKKSNILILLRNGDDKKSEWLLKYGTSSKLAEMMLSGVPIVTNPVEANPSEFHQYVTCVEGTDPKTAAECVYQVTKDEEEYAKIIEKAQRAREYYLNHALWIKQKESVKKFLEDLMGIDK